MWQGFSGRNALRSLFLARLLIGSIWVTCRCYTSRKRHHEEHEVLYFFFVPSW